MAGRRRRKPSRLRSSERMNGRACKRAVEPARNLRPVACLAEFRRSRTVVRPRPRDIPRTAGPARSLRRAVSFSLLVPFLLSCSTFAFSCAPLAARRRMLHGATSPCDPPRHMAVTHTQPPCMGIIARASVFQYRARERDRPSLHRGGRREREEWRKGRRFLRAVRSPFTLPRSARERTGAQLSAISGREHFLVPSSDFTIRVVLASGNSRRHRQARDTWLLSFPAFSSRPFPSTCFVESAGSRCYLRWSLKGARG